MFPRRFLAISLPALLLASAAPRAFAARLSVVVSNLKGGHQKVIDALTKNLRPEDRILVYDLKSADLSDPVAKGRFLSRIAAADIIIPIGDPASRLISRELDDLKTFFISAGGLSGQYLSQSHVMGILSYSPEETVRVAHMLLPSLKSVGVLYTPGYESILERMRSSARPLNLSVEARRVSTRLEVAPAAREIVGRTDILWVVGDPLLTQDPVFSYLVEESLRLKKPLASPLPELVRRGALFCTVPDNDKLASLASMTLSRLLSDGIQVPKPNRLQPAPTDSYFLINDPIARKWNIHAPASRLWNDYAP